MCTASVHGLWYVFLKMCKTCCHRPLGGAGQIPVKPCCESTNV